MQGAPSRGGSGRSDSWGQRRWQLVVTRHQLWPFRGKLCAWSWFCLLLSEAADPLHQTGRWAALHPPGSESLRGKGGNLFVSHCYL